MQQGKRNKFRILVLRLPYLILFVLGFLLGKLIEFEKFKIDENINLIDIASIITTLGVAWWVTKVLDKEKEDNRGEKEIALKRTDEIYGNVEDLQSKINSQKIKLIDITSSLKKIHVSINVVYRLLGSRGYNLDPITKSYILHCLGNIKEQLTNTPFLITSKPDIFVENGVVVISDNRLNLLEVEFEALKNYMMEFEFQINSN